MSDLGRGRIRLRERWVGYKIKNLVIFGASTGARAFAKLVIEEGAHRVLAFTVDSEFLTVKENHGLPVVPFENLLNFYDPAEFELILPIGYTKINTFRAEKLQSAKANAITIGCWVSRKAHVPQGFSPKENTLIYPGAFIQPFCEIGNNCIIGSGVNLGHHSKVANNCFLATGVVTGGNVQIDDNCCIGLAATIKNELVLAPKTFVGAGAVVMRDTEPNRAYVGNPARQVPAKTSMELTPGPTSASSNERD